MPLSNEPHSDGMFYYICRVPPANWTHENPSSWFVANWEVSMIMKHTAGFMTDSLYKLERKPLRLFAPLTTYFWLAGTTVWEYDMLDAVGVYVLTTKRKFYLASC